MFNLVQIQEQLKGMPLPAVMQYANGSNPEVPPYVALTELNRRKQMEQAASVQQPPNQTVADQVKQGAMGMMQMAAQQEQATGPLAGNVS